MDGVLYIVDHDVVSHMARRRTSELNAYCAHDPDTKYELIVVDDDDDGLRTVLVEQVRRG